MTSCFVLAKRVRLEDFGAETMSGRVFISYSRAEPEPTQELAKYLTAEGYSVWWDTSLEPGQVFRDVIDRELDAADAVIVIWTPHSVASNWVIAEADHGARQNKLITVRTRNLESWRIPKPYNTYQTDIVDNRETILAAVRRVAGVARGAHRPVSQVFPAAAGDIRRPKSKEWRPSGEVAMAMIFIFGLLGLKFVSSDGTLVLGIICLLIAIAPIFSARR